MRPRDTRAAKANPKPRSASFFALLLGSNSASILTDESAANDRALRDLLARDGRDTADVPGFDALADRQADLLELIVATPARGLASPVAEARCARLHPHERGFDVAQALALSAADALLRLAGAGPSPTGPALSPLDPSRDAAAEMPPKRKNPTWPHDPTPPVASPSCVATTNGDS